MFIFLFCFSSSGESIRILLAKIARTVAKLFKGVFLWKVPSCSPKLIAANVWYFHVLPLVELNLSVYCKWESVERMKSYSTMCFVLKSPLGRFFRKSNSYNKILVLILKLMDVFCQDAPTALIWAKIAWKVEKLLMVLFKLEIPVPDPNLGSLGENELLEVFGSVGTPKRHFLAQDRVVWRVNRQNRPSRFYWAGWQQTNKIKKEMKTNRKLVKRLVYYWVRWSP
jgi:hypothetical protein